MSRNAHAQPLADRRGAPCIDAAVEHLAATLYMRARAAHWALPTYRFAETLRRSAARRFGDEKPTEIEAARYLESLHLEDLALASACAEGSESAWEFFFARYREELYRAARAIVGSGAGEAQARDLADSLYAELYGVNDVGESPQGLSRGSLFRYYHGRSKLSTWLRAVLAQRHVDALRASRRTESLDDAMDGRSIGESERGTLTVALPHVSGPLDADPDLKSYLALFQEAFTGALRALTPRERLRLAYYYVHQRTLAEIGRILGEHEASVSRHLDRTRRLLRQSIVEKLRRGDGPSSSQLSRGNGVHSDGLSEAQIQLCFEYALGDWPFDLSRALAAASEGESGSTPQTLPESRMKCP